jgi:hypothetical protein
MLPTRLLLVDRWAPLSRAWSEAFASIDVVEVHEDDFFARDADAMVAGSISPFAACSARTFKRRSKP